MTPTLRRTRSVSLATSVLVVAVTLAGCAQSVSPASSGASTPSSGSSAAVGVTRSAAPTPAAAKPAAVAPAGPTPWSGTRQPPAGIAWSHVSASPGLAVATVDGGNVTLMWMDPSLLRFRFVPGTKWPERSPMTAADSQSSTWTAHLVAAFNGGFKLSDHVGGYYYQGHVVAPLLNGDAALAVRRDGSLSVGVWGNDLTMSPDLVVVRENLHPIVLNGVSQAKASDTPTTWGLTLQHLRAVNRSALGQLADGSLVFVFGHLIIPQTVARELIAAGAQQAMMLDMNVTWPTGFLYSRTGGRFQGTKINPHIKRSPSIYLAQFEKDFVAVESR